MSSKFSTRHSFFGTLDGVGVKGLIEQGVVGSDLPEGDDGLRSAYEEARSAHIAAQEAEARLMDVARQSQAAPEIRSPWHGRGLST